MHMRKFPYIFVLVCALAGFLVYSLLWALVAEWGSIGSPCTVREKLALGFGFLLTPDILVGRLLHYAVDILLKPRAAPLAPIGEAIICQCIANGFLFVVFGLLFKYGLKNRKILPYVAGLLASVYVLSWLLI
jgi:hypothetical protein